MNRRGLATRTAVPWSLISWDVALAATIVRGSYTAMPSRRKAPQQSYRSRSPRKGKIKGA
jgi:hypothetical protein